MRIRVGRKNDGEAAYLTGLSEPTRAQHANSDPLVASRFPPTRSWDPQLRISVTPGLFTDSTRTWAVLPPPVVYGRPITCHSLRSSASRSPSLSSIGRTRSSGGAFFSGDDLAIRLVSRQGASSG